MSLRAPSREKDGWSGRLLYTTAPGAWEDIAFSGGLGQFRVEGLEFRV